MKKEEKSTPTSAKHRSVYKYQLKATNQILKDTLDLCKSSLHHTAHTNRYKQNPFQDLDLYLFDQSYIDKFMYDQPKISVHDQPKKYHNSNDIFNTNLTKKSFQEIQPSKKSLQKYSYNNFRHQKLRKQDFFQRQQMINSQIYSFSSQNSNFPTKKQKNSLALLQENYSKKDNLYENKKEVKRQRRGLANISLKVKNIVAKLGKMTFKEVSDEVLKESEEYLPEQIQARQKQMRNIRRRVYDALNVLVSVGILGKCDRCVTHTSITTVPGKKLSEHWQVLNQKNRIIQQMQSSYTNKLIDLNKLKKSFQKMLLFHERNRQLSELSEKKEDSTRSHQRENFSMNTQQLRFYFPIIIVFPPKNSPMNMKVQIQQEQKPSQKIKKFVIEGSDQIQTQLALLNYLNLKSHLDRQNGSKQKEKLTSRNPKYGGQQKQQTRKIGPPSLKLEEDIYLSD